MQTNVEGAKGEFSPRETCRQEWLISFAPGGHFSNEKVRWKALGLIFPTHFFVWKTASWSKSYEPFLSTGFSGWNVIGDSKFLNWIGLFWIEFNYFELNWIIMNWIEKCVGKPSLSAFQRIFSFEKRPQRAKVMNPSCRQVFLVVSELNWINPIQFKTQFNSILFKT